MSIRTNNLLRYRNVWLGFAMMWIMLSHSGLVLSSKLFTYLKLWGYGGVDICLFASGIGCYFSLEKDPDGLRFLKRRVIRLAPAYLCFTAIWCIFCVVVSGMSAQEVLGNLLGIQYLTGAGKSLNWYIGGLVVFYLLAPYLKALADRLEKPWMHLVVVAVMLLVTVVYWDANKFILIVTRIPIIYIGMVFAKQCRQGKQIGAKEAAVSAAAMLAGIVLLWAVFRFLPDVLWSHGWHWYPFILITPGLCILISTAAMGLETCRPGQWLVKLPALIGKNSFEVFLVHIPMYEACLNEGYLHSVLEPLIPDALLPMSENQLWICTIPVVAVGCVLLKAAAKTVSRLFRRSTASV